MSSRRDDYLFDPNAQPDPEVAALERALAPLRHGGGRPSDDVLDGLARRFAPPASKRGLRGPTLVGLALAAAALVWGLVAWSLGSGLGSGLGDGLAPGATTREFVAKKGEVTIPLGELAELTLHPGGALDFVHWRAGDEARFRLRRGRLDVRVAPPPAVHAGFFVVETPDAVVVDQGCRYELVVRDDGGATVVVNEGAVTFASGGREVFVPAGAIARLDSETRAVSTPLFVGASSELRALVEKYDASLHMKGAPDRQGLVRKFAMVCQRPADTLPLWHLLKDDDPNVVKEVHEILFQLAGPPDGSAQLLRMFGADEWLAHLRQGAWQGGG